MSAVDTEVAAFEHGRLRLWAVDASTDAGRALVEALRSDPRDAGPVQAALGAERVDPYWLDLVKTGDVAEMGLAGYLRQGYDAPEDQIDAADLSTDAGYVLIAPSRAFGDDAQTLEPDAALAPLATIELGEDVGSLRPMEPIETAHRDHALAAAEPEPTGPPSGRALRPGAILILLLIAAAFVALVAL